MNNQGLRLAPTILLAAAAATATPPTVKDLGLTPGDTSVLPAVSSQQGISISKGREFSLVTWTDYRGRSAGTQSVQSDGDVFGIRVAADGTPIDAAPFLIAGGMGLQEKAHVAWNGQAWLVLYKSQEIVGGYYQMLLRAVRVSEQGQVLDPSPIAFPPDAYDPSDIGLQVSGQNGQWLVTRCLYHDDGYGTYLAGQRISSGGQILDTTPVMLQDWLYGPTVSLVCGGEYLVAAPTWNDSAIITARRVNQNAQPVGASFNIPSLAITTNGSEYYVTWIKDYIKLVGSRMTPTGTLLDPSGTTLISDSALAYFQSSLTHDGTNWWVEWGSGSSVWTMRVSPAGIVLDPGGVNLPIVIGGTVDQAYDVTISRRTGGGVHALWYDLRPAMGYDTNIYSIPLSPGNVPGTERCVSTATTNQRSPDLSRGPAGTSALAFVSEAANDDRVLVHLLGPSGNPTTPEPIEVYRGPTVGKTGIAFNGSFYMIAWDQGASGQLTDKVFARRMHPDGTFIDAAPFLVMSGFNADIGDLGEDFLVAGARYGAYPQYINLVAMRIDGPTAQLLDGTGLLLAGNYSNGQPRVRADGSKWLVASHSMWSHDSSQGDAILATVPPAGPPTLGFNPTPFSGASGDLDIAFSGGKYLLVWRMNSLANANNAIAGRIMNADGTFPGGYFTIAEAAGRQLRPTVDWDGSTFIVAWDDQRNQESFFDARTDVYATRVTETGTILDPSAFPVASGPQAHAGAAILARPGRSTMVADTRFIVTAPLDSYRIGLSTVGDDVCPADFDGTGFVDTEDFDAFVRSFEVGTIDADFDGTGFVDLDDFTAFVLAFEAGC